MRAAAFTVLTLLAMLSMGASAWADTVPTTPYPGAARSIGSAANGCLAGAQPLPLSGPGWEVLHPERNRFWGNPALIAFLESVAAETRAGGSFQIGDIAQPRGGHMVSGHGSHQTGLDVDIMFRAVDAPLTAAERMAPQVPSMLRADGTLDTALWGDRQLTLLRRFATDPEVERIFVNPAIKRALCQSETGDRSWLHRVRPWWGHEEHFHVRLRCPDGDHECINGAPIPAGDGCDATLDWWFTPEAAAPAPAKPGALPPPVPAACHDIQRYPDMQAP